MKAKYLVIVALLLAILTIGAVSASDTRDDLAVGDDGADIIEAPVDDGASAGDVIGTHYDDKDGEGFDADVEDEVRLENTHSVVDVWAPQAGNISISVYNGSSLPDVTHEVSEADVSSDKISFNLTDLGISKAGTYWLSAKFINSSGNEKIYFTDHYLTVLEKENLYYGFYVDKFVLIGDNSDMFLSLSNLPSGNFTIVLDGETTLVNEKMEDYSKYWYFRDFNIAKGKHYVQLFFGGDEDYNSFESEKYDFIYDDWIVYVPDRVFIGGQDCEITVYLPNEEGYLTVFIDDEKCLNDSVKNLNDGDEDDVYVVIDLEDMSLGNHTYNVTYTNGDEKTSVNGSFEVDFIFKVECERYEEDWTIYFGEDTSFYAMLPDGATGTISVVVAGENLTFTYDSTKDIVISNLELGWNYLNFTYSGDAVWPKKSCYYEIETSAGINVPDYFNYGGDEAIELTLPANATGNLTVSLNGDEGYTVFKTVELKNGKASISLWDLGFGKYDIQAYYTGDDYDVDGVGGEVTLLPKVTYDYYVFRNATSTITVESPKDTKGNFTIILRSDDGYEDYKVLYNASVKDIITLTLPDNLNGTSYNIIIQFAGNNNSFESPYGLRVMDEPSTWDLNAKFIKEVNIYDADDVEDAWSITIPKEMGYGNVYIYVDGKLVREREIYNGEHSSTVSGYLELTGLSLGTHTWKIEVVPNSYFKNQTAEGTFEGTWIIVPEEVYGNEMIVFDNDDENATGTLSMSIDGKDYAAEFVKEGKALIELKNLTLGEHTYEITYSGDKTHPKLTKSGKFNVSQMFYFVNMEDGDVLPYYAFYPIFINLDQDATGTVTATIGNITKTATVVDGHVEFNFTGLSEGNYTITAKYSGNSKYPAQEISCNFTIEGYQIILDGEDDSPFFALVLPSEATGNLTVYLEDSYYGSKVLKTVELKDGQAVIKISDLNLTYGYFRLYAVYVGDYSEVTPAYLSFNRLPEVNITDKLIIGENANIKIDLGNGTGNISIYLNEKIFDTVELKDGKLDFNISSVNLTTYNEIYFRYIGDDFDKHLFDEFDSELDIYSPKIFTVFVQIKNLTIPSTLAGGNGNITMELPENYAGNVSVYVDGKKASTTPVKGGKVTIPISNLKTGENDVRVEINGNDGSKYYARSTVDVPKPEPSVNIVTPKDSKTPQFIVNLPGDATGTLIVNIGGKNYVADLINGSATIAPTGLADGTYNATIKYSGDANYSEFEKTQNVTIKTAVDAKIVADDLTVIYSSNGLYSVVVYGTDGNVAANTEVTFLINGKVYKIVKTNEKGVASIAITQKPGTYKITAKALDINVTKKLTVKHILKLKKVKVKRSAKKLVIKATLAKVNGKYLKNKKVTLKFKGKKYTAKTNKKGVAKFTIKSKVLKKLKAGKKVTYQATYLKDTVKRTVKVKK